VIQFLFTTGILYLVGACLVGLAVMAILGYLGLWPDSDFPHDDLK
jgi:hypothetical protein